MKFRRPMSAKNYEKNERRVKYPCYVQPKLDGIRCVTDGTRFWSRNGKLFPLVNMAGLRLGQRLDYLVDGELMIPGGLFEDIVSAVKKASGTDRTKAEKLRFCAFDMIIGGQPFEERHRRLQSIVKSARAQGAKWTLVPTDEVHHVEQLDVLSKELLAAGHEGSMIRNAEGLYVSKRSFDLLKRKPLLDAEYEIVDVKEAKGKDKGTPVFICCVGKPKDEKLFRVRPMGTEKQRKKMWKDRANLIGMMLTVEFQNLTKHGVPRFPRGKVLRDYE